MYLISAGHAVALGPKGELYKIMSQGSHFGEVGMLLPVPRTATVRVQESTWGARTSSLSSPCVAVPGCRVGHRLCAATR